MPGEIVHFDIPVDDVDNALDFYGYVMGWKFEKYGEEGAGGDQGGMVYWLISTDPDNKDAVGGGIGQKQMPEQGLVNYYKAEGGLEAFNKRVKDKGGQVMMEKMPVPGFGWMSVCVDPEGNPFGGWVDDTEAKME